MLVLKSSLENAFGFAFVLGKEAQSKNDKGAMDESFIVSEKEACND